MKLSVLPSMCPDRWIDMWEESVSPRSNDIIGGYRTKDVFEMHFRIVASAAVI